MSQDIKFRRSCILFMILIVWIVAYTDRANVTLLVTNKAFTDTFGITGKPVQEGLLMTLFLLPYGLSNFIVGPIIDRFNARRVLLVAFIFWGVCTIVSGMLSAFSALLVLRILLGISESPVTPSLHRVVKNWFPMQQRGLANTFWLIGNSIAPVIGLPIVSWIMLSEGWRESFYWVGVIGIIVPVVVMWFTLYDSPSSIKKRGTAEQNSDPHVERNLEPDSEKSTFKKKDYWYLVANYSLALGFNWGITSWFPSFLKDGLHINAVTTGYLAAAPWMGNVIVALIGGPLSDKMRGRRTKLIIIAPLAGAMLLLLSLLTHNVTLIIILSTLAAGVNYFTLNPSQATLQRIANPKQTATAAGVYNGIAYVWSAAIPYIMGLLLASTHAYVLGFVFIIITAVAAAITGFGVYHREPTSLEVNTSEQTVQNA